MSIVVFRPPVGDVALKKTSCQSQHGCLIQWQTVRHLRVVASEDGTQSASEKPPFLSNWPCIMYRHGVGF